MRNAQALCTLSHLLPNRQQDVPVITVAMLVTSSLSASLAKKFFVIHVGNTAHEEGMSEPAQKDWCEETPVG